MVERDHTRVGPTETFFSESMRRDAMSGTRTGFALEIEDDINRRDSPALRNKKLTSQGRVGMMAGCRDEWARHRRCAGNHLPGRK